MHIVKNIFFEDKISRLKSKRNNNSGNSSNPPSTNQAGNKRANFSYNSRKKTDKRQGGQKGHKSTTLTKQIAEKLFISGKCKHTISVCGNPDAGYHTTKYELDIQNRAGGCPLVEQPPTDHLAICGNI